jgi:AraC-like DNA-binding protein
MTGVLKFSTDSLPDRDRVAIWREEFARGVVKVEVQRIGEEPFRSESRIRVLPDLKIWSSQVTSSELRRTPPLVADGDDSVVLALINKGQTSVAQRNQDVIFREGEAFLWASDATGHYRNPGFLDFVTFAFPRRSLRSVVRDLDGTLMKAIPLTTEALRLLRSYAAVLQAESGSMAPGLLALSSAHILDLAALALGATRDAEHNAKDGGLRAARLQAIKADIIANLSQPGLAVAAVALRHGISPRYIRALFEREQMSFSGFVREQRLRRAYRLLRAPETAERSISAIAFDSGFSDLSYFNHLFRSRFGATPTDIRNQSGEPVNRTHGGTGWSGS